MPKLSKEDIEKRESFIREFVQAHFAQYGVDDSPSAAKINKDLKAKFGSEMRPPRIYELRDEVKKEFKHGGVPTTTPPAAKAPVLAAGRNAETGSQSPLPLLLQVEPGETPVTFLGKALGRLREAGVANLSVELSTEKYIVVNATP